MKPYKKSTVQVKYNTDNIFYTGRYDVSKTRSTKSIELIGIDTEAYNTGQCFLICTSEGDSFKYLEYPECFFTRKYRGKKFIAYNLKYDEGAFLQFLDDDHLKQLWKTGKTEYNGYRIKSIPHKCLTISRKSHSINIYDIYQFYQSSLNVAAKKYLGEEKIEMVTKSFTPEFIKENYELLVKYCIQDCMLTKKLADLLIKTFESFGVYPSKLYSTAYVSYQYFREKCHYITVRDIWDNNREVLDYAMQSYKGGKFEVTEKGTGYFYEYDIVSAYPFEIANLVDITYARFVYSKSYRRYAIYGFMHVKMKIPGNVYNPTAIKYGTLNIYPVGEIETHITKQEYEYFISHNVDITIIDAVWIHVDNKIYPYRKEINRLVAYKKQFKVEDKKLHYHTVKILMNSLYGKMLQLIEHGDRLIASSCWNPIYGAIITANTRIKITNLQQLYPEIVGVHTDSVISKKALPIATGKELGDFDFECEGNGVILGSGIYQIGDKNRFRGFTSKRCLLDMIETNKSYIEMQDIHALSWREVAFRGYDMNRINRFETIQKRLNVSFDSKRLWIKDYKSFKEVKLRNVLSYPIVWGKFGF